MLLPSPPLTSCSFRVRRSAAYSPVSLCALTASGDVVAAREAPQDEPRHLCAPNDVDAEEVRERAEVNL